MLLAEQVEKKWKSILEHPDLPEIGDAHRRQVTAMVLENQESDLIESQNGGMFTEAAPTNSVGAMTGNVTKYDPILISLVRRAVPQMIAFDVAGVQPMTGPTGLIFALRARYATTSAASPGLIAKANQADGATSPGEALFNEADTDYSSLAQDAGATTHAGTDAGAAATIPKTGMTTATAEALGDATTNSFAQMGFTIDKVTVTAVSRALKAEYTMELAQDLKAIHGLDAETELANILSTEILSEINREVIRTIYSSAELGAQINTASAGTFNLTPTRMVVGVLRNGRVFCSQSNAMRTLLVRGLVEVVVISSSLLLMLHLLLTRVAFLTMRLRCLPELMWTILLPRLLVF